MTLSIPRPGPLNNIQVLDFTRLFPGPCCTRILADLGARVIKIEDTEGGDYFRWMGPPVSRAGCAGFNYLNRGKHSLVIDLKAAGARQVIDPLLSRADVLIEGFRPGVMAKFGLDHASVLKDHPKLVYASITGYGQDGPLADRAGHDVNYMALAGMYRLDEDSTRVLPTQLADLLGGGQTTATAILAALVEVKSGGSGRFLDISMTQAVQSLAGIHFAEVMSETRPPEGEHDILGGMNPGYAIYACRDKTHLAVAALEPKFWIRLTRALGIDDLPVPMMEPAKNWPPIRERLQEALLSRTASEWAEFLGPHDCCVEPVLTPREALDHPQAQVRGVGIPVSTGDGTQLLQPAPVVHGVPDIPKPDHAAPRYGQHTREILQEIGLDRKIIDELLQSAVVVAEKA